MAMTIPIRGMAKTVSSTKMARLTKTMLTIRVAAGMEILKDTAMLQIDAFATRMVRDAIVIIKRRD